MAAIKFPKPEVGDCVLYDNGGRDMGEEGKVTRVISSRSVKVNGVEREVRFIARGVWVIKGPIGPNKYAKQYHKGGINGSL